jgi:hypothetical protein
VATPETEAALLAHARRATARALRDALRPKRDEPDEEAARFMSLSLSLSNEDGLLLEATMVGLGFAFFCAGCSGLLGSSGRAARGGPTPGPSRFAGGVTDRLRCRKRRRVHHLVPEDVAARHADWLTRQEAAARLRRAAEERVESRITRECAHTEAPVSVLSSEGEHEARLKVRGTADAPKWILGRRPILVIEGRTKREPREDERRAS